MTTDPAAAAAAAAEVESWIPHRPPFRYVDRVLAADASQLSAEVTVRTDEPWCSGHYPGNPIMPGVLILECIFQAGAIFLSQRLHAMRNVPAEQFAADAAAAPAPGVPVLTRIGAAKFRKAVKPGDVIQLDVRLDDHAANAFRLSGSASVDGKKAVTVEFTCALVDGI
ncbi:MAG: 3-hydroxyacyl-ACP dehydratase FabZ family protein [Planctomycetota bacterium]